MPFVIIFIWRIRNFSMSPKKSFQTPLVKAVGLLARNVPVLLHLNTFTFRNIHPYFNLFVKTRLPYNNCWHKLAGCKVWRFAKTLISFSKAGFSVWETFFLIFVICTSKCLIPKQAQIFCASLSLSNEVWERNHRHPSGLATVSDRSSAKSSVYTGD